MSQERFVGVDVSRAWPDVAGRPDPALVVLEATGGSSPPVVAALQVAGW